MIRNAAKSIDISGAVRHHLGSARAALLGTPYWVWPLPLFLCLAILLIRQTPLGWYTGKEVQELVAPAVIGLTAGIALYVHLSVRSFFTLLLACFAGALFMRELHFYGTSNGAYAAIILLAWWASSRRDEIHHFLQNPSIRGLLAGALWTYFITKMFDRHYFSFLPDYLAWHDNVEETLETLGHALVMGLAIVTLRIGSLQGKNNAESDPPNPDSDTARGL